MGHSQASLPSPDLLLLLAGPHSRGRIAAILCTQGGSEKAANAAAGVLVGLPPAQLHKESLVLICLCVCVLLRVVVLEQDIK